MASGRPRHARSAFPTFDRHPACEYGPNLDELRPFPKGGQSRRRLEAQRARRFGRHHAEQRGVVSVRRVPRGGRRFTNCPRVASGSAGSARFAAGVRVSPSTCQWPTLGSPENSTRLVGCSLRTGSPHGSPRRDGADRSGDHVAAQYPPAPDARIPGNVELDFRQEDGYDLAERLEDADLVFLDPPYFPDAKKDWRRVGHVCRTLASRRIAFVAWYPFYWPTNPQKLSDCTDCEAWEASPDHAPRTRSR